MAHKLMRKENAIAEKSKVFAIRIIRLFKYLSEKKKESVLSRQLLRSGTSIGANIREAAYGHSKKDFAAKMCIALKECSETAYWLEILYETNFLTEKQYKSIEPDCTELIKLLTSIINSVKRAK